MSDIYKVIKFTDIQGKVVTINPAEVMAVLANNGFRLFGLEMETILSMRTFFARREYPITRNKEFRDALNNINLGMPNEEA